MPSQPSTIPNESAAGGNLMKIQLQIPRVLEQYSGGKSEFDTQCQSIAELLDFMRQEQPDVYYCVCDETGRLRQHVNLFVNNELLLERDNFKTKLNDGDVVSVFQSVSGG